MWEKNRETTCLGAFREGPDQMSSRSFSVWFIYDCLTMTAEAAGINKAFRRKGLCERKLLPTKG